MRLYLKNLNIINVILPNTRQFKGNVCISFCMRYITFNFASFTHILFTHNATKNYDKKNPHKLLIFPF